jgi:hypothetical protein
MPGFFYFRHFVSVFHCDSKREFFITYRFTKMTMLYLLCLLGNTRARNAAPVRNAPLDLGKPSKPSARVGRLVSESNALTDGVSYVGS